MEFENKVFIKNHKATFVCPKCRKAETEDASAYQHIMEPISIQRVCQCGQVYKVKLERRIFHRKKVNLPGVYYIISEKTQVRSMRVRDISRSGVKIQLREPHHLQIGDVLNVEFHLDNKHRTLIKKEVIVRNIFSKNTYGTEFTSRNLNNPYDKAYDIAIGFYIFQ